MPDLKITILDDNGKIALQAVKRAKDAADQTAAGIETVNAAVVAAQEEIADLVVDAAAVVNAVQPIFDADLQLERRIGVLTANAGNQARLQADGRWKVDSGNAGTLTWDVNVSAADLARGAVTIDFPPATVPSGASVTYTAEQRDAAGTTLAAAVSVPVVNGRNVLTITSPNASLGILRIVASAPYTTAGARYIGAPAVNWKRPATLPSDADYYALIGERLNAKDGAQISLLNALFSATKIDTDTFRVAANVDGIGTYALSKNVRQNIVVLVEIASDSFSPALLTVSPLNGEGAAGTAIRAQQFRWGGSNARFIVPLPATVSGKPTLAFNVRCYATVFSPDGANIGVPEPVTITARAYDSDGLPALRTLPAVVEAAIEEAVSDGIVKAAVQRDAAIEAAYRTNVYRNEVTATASWIAWLNSIAQFYISPAGSDANAGSVLAPIKNPLQAVFNSTAGSTSITVTRTVFGAFTPGQPLLNGPRIPAGAVTNTVVGSTVTYTGASGATGTNTNLLAGNVLPGRALLFERGRRHYGTEYSFPAVHIGGYGLGADRAFLDSRLDLSGNTWTLSSGRWRTVASLPFPMQHDDGVAGANSGNFTLYLASNADLIGKRFKWYYKEGSQAANQAAVTANPNGWTINALGSTSQDPRVGGAANNVTDHEIYVNMPDGSDPNGQRILLTARRGYDFVAGGSRRDVTYIGCCAKDAVSGVAGPDGAFPLLENVRSIDGPAHCWVGALETRGRNYFIARAPEGTANPKIEILGRSVGGALNFFSAFDYSNKDLVLRGTVFAGCAGTGFYGHTGNDNCAYRSGYFEHLVGFNSGATFGFDGNTTGNKMFVGDVTIDYLESGPWTDPETGISYDGSDSAIWTGYVAAGKTFKVNRGYHIGSKYTTSNSGGFLQVCGPGTIHIKNFTYTPRHLIGDPTGTTINGVLFDQFASNYLISDRGSLGSDRPTAILEHYEDGSPIGKAASLSSAFGNMTLIALDLRANEEGPTVCGDIAGQDFNVFPRKLFVAAGCTFGFGNRTRAQIIAALLAAGKTSGTDFLIDPETWIVNKAGVIIDIPESLKL